MAACMNKQQIVIRNRNLITPSLHDGLLVGLIAPGHRQLLILTKNTNQATYCLVLSGVEHCRADDFREGNIILDITIEEGDNVGAEDVAYLLGQGTDHPFVQNAITRIRAEKLLLLRINPSYGCTLVVLCRVIELTEDWMDLLIGR
jgi:hypothetical protein